MGGNACKKYGVQRLNHKDYTDACSVLLKELDRLHFPTFIPKDFIKESYGDIDIVISNTSKADLCQAIENIIVLGKVRMEDRSVMLWKLTWIKIEGL